MEMEKTLRISWAEQVRNGKVFKRMDMGKSIWNMPRIGEKLWTGHLTRNNLWWTTIIKGKLENKLGRSRTILMKQVKEDIWIKSNMETKRTIKDKGILNDTADLRIAKKNSFESSWT